MPKWTKNQWKIDQKLVKIEVWRRLGAYWGILWHLWVSWGHPGRPKDAPKRVLGRLGSKKVANMAPTWLPKRSRNREKIEAKIDQNFDGSWGQIFSGFWWILEAKWSQVGTKIASKIDPNFERRFFEKTLFFLRKNNDFEGSGGRSWNQKSHKID